MGQMKINKEQHKQDGHLRQQWRGASGSKKGFKLLPVSPRHTPGLVQMAVFVSSGCLKTGNLLVGTITEWVFQYSSNRVCRLPSIEGVNRG
jgi:hypothetical protein